MTLKKEKGPSLDIFFLKGSLFVFSSWECAQMAVIGNAASDAPENVMARQALEQEPVTLGKRKAIDEMEYAERAAKLRELNIVKH